MSKPRSALLIVDIQYDFCEGGCLEVKESSMIIEPINQLIQSGKYDFIIASMDWHPPNHISFASNHTNSVPFDSYELLSMDKSKKITSILWPDHCVQNSKGAELHQGLNISKIDYIVKKGVDPSFECYSAFYDVHKEKFTELHKLLTDNHITEVTVVGLAFDYCVSETAISASSLGYKTSIDMQCTRGISDESVRVAREKCVAANVYLVE